MSTKVRLSRTSQKATVPADLRSKTAKTAAACPVLDPEPKGYSEPEKERIYWTYRKRGSKRAISRIFGISPIESVA